MVILPGFPQVIFDYGSHPIITDNGLTEHGLVDNIRNAITKNQLPFLTAFHQIRQLAGLGARLPFIKNRIAMALLRSEAERFSIPAKPCALRLPIPNRLSSI